MDGVNSRVSELLVMLSYRRPHTSSNEKIFTSKFILPLGVTAVGTLPDGAAAYVKFIPTEDGEDSRTLFSSHLDTVHRDDAMQEVLFDAVSQTAFKTDGTPLGADDGAGVWLMMQMIRAEVPGTYVFHRGEERGGIGSSHIAANFEDFLGLHDRAVAFDRKATSSVITHQSHGRCCSDTFAEALCGEFNDRMPDDIFAPDPTGVYTDTAEYVDAIGECTNVSCGYYSEHTSQESLDVAFLERLADACINIDWENLPTVRKPGEEDEESKWPFTSWGVGGSRLEDEFDMEDLTVGELMKMSDKAVEDMCWDFPTTAANALIMIRNKLESE